MYYTINALVVTYNQQDSIGRALDSILMQKEYGLNSIIIRDDCSTDNNWKIIEEYARKYPKIIKAYRNEINLGIYGNIQESDAVRGEADLYFHLAGDDMICDGWFKKVQDFLISRRIEKDSAYLIQSDYKKVFPNGQEKLISQDVILKKKPSNVMKLLRKMLDNRSVMCSKELMNRFDPLLLDNGLNLAEFLYASQGFVHADHFYYVPCVGSLYRAEIGVSIVMIMNKEKYDRYWIDENIVKWMYFMEKVLTCHKDKNYARFQINKCKYEKDGRIRDLLRACWWRLMGIDENVDDIMSVLRDYYILFNVHRRYQKRFFNDEI